MALTAHRSQEQKKQAEELLFSGEQARLRQGALLRPIPGAAAVSLSGVEAGREADRREGRRRGAALRATSTSTPPPSTATPTFRASVIDGLGRLGVLGMTAPIEFGGRGFSQLGLHARSWRSSAGIARPPRVFVNAHH